MIIMEEGEERNGDKPRNKMSRGEQQVEGEGGEEEGETWKRGNREAVA